MLHAVIPMPLQIVIDDVGWWRSDDGHLFGEPYRSGLGRAHAAEDYLAIATLGRELGMRPQAALVLCEWDRQNILQRVPSATWMGEAWDNTPCVGPWLDEAAQAIRENSNHIEPVLHAVGHEYWNAPYRTTRAEWFGPDDAMRPADSVRAHLNAWRQIMEMNGMGDLEVTAFVPAAFRYRFGMGPGGIADILHREQGIRFVSTPFAGMLDAQTTQRPLYGFESGIMTVDRGRRGPLWHESDCRPAGPVQGPILGLHWPNILHFDPARSGEVVARWVEHLRQAFLSPDLTPASNTADAWSQLLYRDLATLEASGASLQFDFKQVDALGGGFASDELVVKIAAPQGARLASDDFETTQTPPPDAGLGTWRLRRRDPTRHACRLEILTPA